MKRNLLFTLVMLVSMMGTQIAVNAQDLTLSDVQNSGCLRENQRRANENETQRTIVLLKEGNILSVQLLNYEANCGTGGFDVTPSMSGGSDGIPCSVTVSVVPICYVDADCICPYNVSFTIHGLESNSFLFSCWWCEGQVTLTDGEPLVLENAWEDISIDGLDYKIHDVMHSAHLMNGKSWAGELNIPSEVNYEGQKYVVTSIGYNAFADNTALTSVTVPNTVLSIGSVAFARCAGLTSIVISEGVKSIASNVFYGCSSLASITIPNSITSIGGDAFTGTAWYNSLPDGVVYAGGIAYTYKGTMPEGTQIDIKEGTIAIANNAFCRCDNLASVTIPGSVSTIGYDAFWQCSNLESVTISEGVKIIEDAAFLDCTSLKSIVIPKSVMRIGEYAFLRCTALTSVTISGSVMRMGMWAFGDCTALTSLDISNGVKDIGYQTFRGCSSLRSVTIPGSVTSIGDGSFFRCSSLESIVISEGVESIGMGVFEECKSLTSVTIPNTMTSIGTYVFFDCSSLTDVYCYADSIPNTEDNVFYGSNFASATLHVPAGSVDSYKAVSPWNEFGNIVAIEKIAKEYFPEGTKWTEIRLDTLKYDSWYSKIGDEWVPNFETIEYRVQGIYSNFSETFGDNSLKCVYTNCSEWTDSLSLLIIEGEINEYLNYGRRVMATVPIYFDTWDVPSPAMAYNFDWRVGMPISFIDILSTTYDHNSETAVFGIIEEINEGNFGGVRPLNYTDVNGVRIIQGIGVTTWNDGECIFGPVRPYDAMAFHQGIVYPERHYRSMLVHFERDGEVLYNVWPEKEAATEVTYTKDQMATIILPTEPDASKGKYYRLDRVEDRQIIFEQELQPQAHVPYIIMPSEDFSIDLSTLDLAGCYRDTVSIEGISFIGSFVNMELPALTGGDGGGSFYIDIIDTTPDCGISSSGETGKGAFIGALRAYLQVSWDDPYNQGGTRGLDDKMRIVLLDYGTGVENVNLNLDVNHAVFDLGGRKVTNGKLPKGIYIKGGKKKMVK